jgi:hypothetical protein
MPSKEQEVTTLVKPEYQNFTLSDLLRKPTHALFKVILLLHASPPSQILQALLLESLSVSSPRPACASRQEKYPSSSSALANRRDLEPRPSSLQLSPTLAS